ncbi:MAG: phosphopantetheine-binding protein [Actinomycetota bacterium]
MTTTEQLADLRRLLADVTGRAEVLDLDVGTDLFGAGILDSFGIIAVIGALEDEWEVLVPDEDLVPDNFWTLTALDSLVRRL